MAYSRYATEMKDGDNNIYGMMDEEAREQLSDLNSAINQYDKYAVGIVDVLFGAQWTENYFLNDEGTVTSNNNYKYCDYVQIDPGNYQLIVKNNTSSTHYARIHGYDQNKANVSLIKIQTVAGNSGFLKYDFSIPDGKKYIRVSFGKADDIMILNTKESLVNTDNKIANRARTISDSLTHKLTKEEFYIPFSTTNAKTQLNYSPVFTTGCILKNGEVHSDYTQYSYTQKIGVKQGDIVKVKRNDTGVIGVNIRYLAAYSDSYEIIPASGSDSNIISYTVPSGVAFVVLSIDMSSVQNYTILVETNVIQLKDNANSPSVNTLLGLNISDAFTTESLGKKIIYDVTPSSGQLLPDGSTYATDEFSYTQKIPVVYGDMILARNTSTNFEGAQMRYVTAYYDNLAIAAKGSSSATYEYDVPEGVNYVAITYENSRYSSTGITIVRYTGRTYIKNDNVSNELMAFAKTPEIIVPEKSFAVVGHEWNLYYNNVIDAYDESMMYVLCDGITGKMYDRFLRWTPSEDDVGENEVTVKICRKKDRKVLVTKTITVVVVADSSTSKNIIFVGDSLTDEGTYIHEIQYNLSDGEYVSVGVRTSTATQQADTIHHEGRAGWSAYNYTEQASISGEVNPFWNPSTSKFDFSYYANTYYPSVIGSALPSIDAVMLNLGTNGVAQITRTCDAISEMITSIHSYDSDIIVIVSLITPPATQDGCGQHNNMFSSYEWKCMELSLIKAYLEKYEDELTNVYVSEPYFNIDTLYDFPTKTIAVSSRNPTQITIQDNNVHPNIYGYLKMADVYYANLLYRLSE